MNFDVSGVLGSAVFAVKHLIGSVANFDEERGAH
jgi:hypothetical protein